MVTGGGGSFILEPGAKMINIGSERTLFGPVWPHDCKVLESAGRLAGDWSWEVVGPPAPPSEPRATRRKPPPLQLTPNTPCKAPKIEGRSKFSWILKKTAGYRYGSDAQKTFVKVVEDDYIMESNGLPQLWLRNRHVEEKVPTEMTLTPILHCFILPKYIQVVKGIDPYLVDPKLNTETRLDKTSAPLCSLSKNTVDRWWWQVARIISLQKVYGLCGPEQWTSYSGLKWRCQHAGKQTTNKGR